MVLPPYRATAEWDRNLWCQPVSGINRSCGPCAACRPRTSGSSGLVIIVRQIAHRTARRTALPRGLSTHDSPDGLRRRSGRCTSLSIRAFQTFSNALRPDGLAVYMLIDEFPCMSDRSIPIKASVDLCQSKSSASDYPFDMIKRSERWRVRSPLSRFAHIVERSGLALAGGACGLFVAAHLARSDFSLIGSSGMIFAVMLYGAAGFYLGIDLPPAPVGELPKRRLGSAAEAVELLSAAGTFFAAVAAVDAVTNIILDETARPGAAILVFFSWAVGASMQILAGIIARTRTHIS